MRECILHRKICSGITITREWWFRRKVLSIIYYKSNDKLCSIGSVSFSKIFTLHFDDDDNSLGIGMILYIYIFWVKV